MTRRHLVPAIIAVFVLLAAGTGATPAAEEIPWLTGQGAAFKQAEEDGRPLLVDVWAVWCEPCKLMERTTYADARIVAAMERYVPLKVDADANEVFAERYRADILPTTLVLDAGGGEIVRFVGLIGADDLLESLDRVSAGYAEYVDQISRKRDPVALQAAAGYLLEVGNPGQAASLLKRSAKLMKGAEQEQVETVELMLAEAWLADGQPATAAKALERLSADAATDELRARALQALVRAERLRGHEARAAEILERLREEYPSLAAELDG
jgi:thioredoxin-like negative regulator of GroEL